MSMHVGGGQGPRAEINITPMIDVLLVLIIIFLLITPQKQFYMPGETPQPAQKNQPPPPDSTIVIEVHKTVADQTEIRINKELVAFAELEPRLRDIYKQRAQKVLFLEADHELLFAQVADVMDTVRAADRDIHIGFMPAQSVAAD